MLTMPVPGLPDRQTWDHLPDRQKLAALYDAIDQVWGSLVLTGQHLTARVEALEQREKGDPDTASR